MITYCFQQQIKLLISYQIDHSDDSIFGKIISLNLKDFSFKFYSKGHRNIQGLYMIMKSY